MPKPRERLADDLLDAAHRAGRLDVYAFGESTWGPEPRALADARAAADELVAHKLARFADEPRTTIELTPFGRYWSTEGGYLAFLKSDGAAAATRGGRERGDGEEGGMDPETRRRYQQLRMSLMEKRLKTFWWGFGISIVSFVMSMLSLYLAVTGNR